ncbi:ligase-associated DNA damage response DEXH box helicase [Acetobacter oeni]|nr:ligase-associated DNA damage response DEXH box helicase [Acetobacter oeni]NHO18315.1 ligase-associated DNA damage response DEXH box helicase [Acetobacter oeni]
MRDPLPPVFRTWFARRGWRIHPHQLAMIEAARRGESTLLIAPTGGGKTLAGFLPSLIELSEKPVQPPKIHTIYVSPLKALSTNIADSLSRTVAEMGLPVCIETRTGDTSATQRKRQQKTPPHILLTTPESLSLLLSYPDAAGTFAGLRALIIDEVHALAGTKRGDQLALCAARLNTLAPALRRSGLSATVSCPDAIAAWVSPTGNADDIRRVVACEGAEPDVSLLLPDRNGYLPWSGRMGLGSTTAILTEIARTRLTIVFVNSRAQAELLFQELWKHNTDNLPIGLHHGSLGAEKRLRVEQAMAAGQLRAVVATSSLDLGIDWGDVEQIIQVGAPKEVTRLVQRIGRANHRMNEPSRALLAPASRFEVLECEAAKEAVAARDLDGPPPGPGTLDVLAQHIMVTACSGPFFPDALYDEVRRAAPYWALSRKDFDDVLGFVQDGGYALKAYERHHRLFRDSLGQFWVRNERIMKQFRMNIGTIVDTPMLRVRTRGGKQIGEIDEYFASTLVPGDTFLLSGELFRFIGMRDTTVQVSKGSSKEPRIPVYGGNRLSISASLASRVRAMLHNPDAWHVLPEPVRNWLDMQRRRSHLPGADNLLVETFPHRNRWYLVACCFEGRNAHQTLGMLLTKRLEQAGAGPLGFVASDYMLACWSVREPVNIDRLFDEDMLGDDLTEWTANSAMLRRTFRDVAIISGLIERNHPGREKSRRQMTISSDLLYDVLRRHDPDHVLLRATRADAAHGLTDLDRIAAMLKRIRGRIDHVRLSRVSPLSVPLMLELGREKIKGGAGEEQLLAEADALFAEADASG